MSYAAMGTVHTTGKCEDPFEIYNEETDTCACPPDMRRDASGKCIPRTCADVVFPSDGTCKDSTGSHPGKVFYKPKNKCIDLRSGGDHYVKCAPGTAPAPSSSDLPSGSTFIAIGAGILGVAVLGYVLTK